MKKTGFSLGALVVSVVLSSMGCTKWVPIKTAELPRLNGATSQVIDQTANSRLVVVSTTNVERPDGTLVEIEGKFDLRLRTNEGEILEVDHPIAATLDGDQLTVRGSNLAPREFALSDIQSTEVTQISKGRSAGLAVVIIVLSGALGGILGALAGP